jgi:HK97 gp10 family phage protein
MDNLIQVDIKGIEELQLLLLDLPKRVARNALRGAVYAGAKVLAAEAKVRAPVYTGPVAQGHPPPGTLKRSIITKQIPEKSNDFNQTFYVTVRKGKKYQKQGKKGNLSQDAFYASWVEFGHHYAPRGKHGFGSRKQAMQAVRSGSHVISGSYYMPPKPFMRPAFDSKATEAADAIKQRLAQRIQEEFKK